MLKENTPIVELSDEQLEMVCGGKGGGGGSSASGRDRTGPGGSSKSGPDRGGSDRAVGDPPAPKPSAGSRLSCMPDVSIKEKRVGFNCKYKL